MLWRDQAFAVVEVESRVLVAGLREECGGAGPTDRASAGCWPTWILSSLGGTPGVQNHGGGYQRGGAGAYV